MYEDKIAEGIKYLDQEDDPSWPHQINLDDLQMWSGCQCLIGQLCGEYQDVFDINDPRPFDLGFAIRSYYNTYKLSSEEVDRQYDILTGEWKKRILELRQERPLVNGIYTHDGCEYLVSSTSD